jgi:endonuclease/exonuclease/phosphatase family metal-dependent hydrolase
MFTGRGVLETVLQTLKGPLRILNVHLHMPGWFQDQKVRLGQLKQTFQAVNWSDPLATILAGDFNEHNILENTEFEKLFTKEKFSHPLDNELSLSPTYRTENKFVQEWINRTPDSKRYDYIFTTQLDTLGLTVEKYEPLYLDPVLSDHDPVLLVLGCLEF